MRGFQELRQQCVDRLCHTRVKHFWQLTMAFASNFWLWHITQIFTTMRAIDCCAPFLIILQYLPLWIPKTLSITFLTVGCNLNIIVDWWLGVSILYLGICPLDHSSGSVFCPQWWCISRSHLQCYSNSKGAGRYPSIRSCALVLVAWEHTLYNSVEVFSVVDDFMGVIVE